MTFGINDGGRKEALATAAAKLDADNSAFLREYERDLAAHNQLRKKLGMGVAPSADGLIENVRQLERVVEAYHGRNGTFNFHYSHFDLLSWRVWLEDEGLPRADYDRMDTDDYVVQISHTDNSKSYDSYTVLLTDIMEWYSTSKE